MKAQKKYGATGLYGSPENGYRDKMGEMIVYPKDTETHWASKSEYMEGVDAARKGEFVGYEREERIRKNMNARRINANQVKRKSPAAKARGNEWSKTNADVAATLHPGYRKGGPVKKTGLAMVHKGERVLNKKQAKRYRKA